MPKGFRDHGRRRSSSPHRRRSSERQRSRSPTGRPAHRRESGSYDKRRGFSRSPHKGQGRRSISPRRGQSPHRRSPSPRGHRRGSRSPPRRGRSPSPRRHSSPGPRGQRRSPGPQRRSPGPPGPHRSPSPKGRGPPSPGARRPQSPGMRRSVSPRGHKRHASPPPQRWSPGPVRRQGSGSPSQKFVRRHSSPGRRGREEMGRRDEGRWEMGRRGSPVQKRSFSQERSPQRRQRYTPSPETREARHQKREPEHAGPRDKSRDADKNAAAIGQSIRTYMQEVAQDRGRDRDDYYDSPRNSQREPHTESLSDRFGTKESRPFIPDENIQVGIRRNIPGNEPPVIRREIDPSQVSIVRTKEEGQKPFHAREEFKERAVEEVEERRVITVVPEERRHRQREDERIIEQSHRRPQKVHVELRWPDHERPPQQRRRKNSSGDSEDTEEPQFHRQKKPDNSQFSGIRIEKNYGGARQIRDKRSPERGRHPADRHSPERSTLLRPSYLHQDREGERQEAQPGDLRYNLSRRREHVEEPDEPFDARQKIRSQIGGKFEDNRGRGQGDRFLDRQGFRDERRGFDYRRGVGRERPWGDNRDDNREHLPDFKKRENRYSYEEWRDKPEMIPKADTYYEHDNRGDTDYWRRDRGRGRGRGRFIRGRGGFRGRGNFRPDYNRDYSHRSTSSNSPFGKWTHDKFKELEAEEDKEPTSTTK